MVVTKDGDLELYALHDTPTHTPWSTRGDLALGIGTSYKVIRGLHETEPPPEPWEFGAPVPGHSTPHSITKNLLHEDHPPRGRTATPIAPLFGRGDEDGFPALGKGAANLAATRPMNTRNHSPAAIGTKLFEYAATARGTASTLPARGDSAKQKARSQSRRTRDTSPTRAHSDSVIQHVVDGDISMVMRKRVARGYGLVDVCCPSFGRVT